MAPHAIVGVTSLDALLGPRLLVAETLGAVGVALQLAFLYLVLLLVLRVVLRRFWLVVLVFVAATVSQPWAEALIEG